MENATRSDREFAVVMLPASSEERFFVDGKVLHSTISVGDVFRSAYRIAAADLTDRDAKPAEVRSVTLSVEEIFSHSRQVQSVNSGDIARLYLTGSGQRELRKGDVMG